MSTGTDQEQLTAAHVWDVVDRGLSAADVLVHSQPFTNTIDIVYLGTPDRKFRITVEEVTE